MEKVIKVHFYKCIQDSHDLGTTVEQMVSRVFFHLEVDGKIYDLWSNIRQAAGGDYKEDPIEVDHPEGAKTPISLNYMAFRDAGERYYRKIVGQSNAVFSFGNSTNVRMYDNTINMPYSEEFEINESSPAW
jgi:hypothetical protein